ncbi:MAG: DUF3471 domain-containing protein [Anaerolineales bacterium]|nr:DUF3471 domain-containing protein [Anaerolineales bacterium]
MCIAFYAAHNDKILAGNNEDYVYPNTKVWFIPSDGGLVDGDTFAGGKYARAYFGYDNYFPQGGMNQNGLCFAVTSVPPQILENTAGKPEYDGYLVDKILAECGTVEQALALLDRYFFKMLEQGCLFLGDRTGESAIVEGKAVLQKAGRYQILSNFYQSQAEPGAFPCQRYNLAARMLEENEELSIDLFRRILAATHQESTSQTVYSLIYDLKPGIIYLYHFHNYANVKVIDPSEHWKRGPHAYVLPSLFPKTFAAMVYDREYAFEKDREKMVAERWSSGEFIPVDREILARYVGRYHVGPYGEKYLTVTLEGNHLYAQVTGRNTQEIYPQSENRFVLMQAKGDQTLTFEENNGPAGSITIDAGSGWIVIATRID